jgi:hypothetical protein
MSMSKFEISESIYQHARVASRAKVETKYVQSNH